MDDCIESLGDVNIFTTLDVYSGYWQMNVSLEDHHKTAFVFHYGTYQCVRMPFGLTNALTTFQRGSGTILLKVKRKPCLVYIEDVSIFSKTVEEHTHHVDEVLAFLKEVSITLVVERVNRDLVALGATLSALDELIP